MCCYTTRAALQFMSPEVSSLPLRKPNSHLKIHFDCPSSIQHTTTTTLAPMPPFLLVRGSCKHLHNCCCSFSKHSERWIDKLIRACSKPFVISEFQSISTELLHLISERSHLGQISASSCAMHSSTQPSLVCGSLATDPYLATRPE